MAIYTYIQYLFEITILFCLSFLVLSQQPKLQNTIVFNAHRFYLDSGSPNACEMLFGSLTFDVSVPSPICVGVQAQYACEIGYELTDGSTQRTCLPSLVWDGGKPICTKATCPVTYYQVCYNCDIVDDNCTFVNTPATFDECRTTAINSNFLFVDYETSNCTAFSCTVPQITYTSGNVAIFSSCNKGFFLLLKTEISNKSFVHITCKTC